MDEKEPLHKIALSWATTASLIIIPIVIAYMANSYQEEMSRQKMNSEYVALAINILKEPPKPETKELRTWAVDIIDHYSEIKLSTPLRDSLTQKTGFSYSNTYRDQNGFVLFLKEQKEGLLQSTKDFLGTPYGFGSHDELTTSEFTDKVYREYNITRTK